MRFGELLRITVADDGDSDEEKAEDGEEEEVATVDPADVDALLDEIGVRDEDHAARSFRPRKQDPLVRLQRAVQRAQNCLNKQYNTN